MSVSHIAYFVVLAFSIAVAGCRETDALPQKDRESLKIIDAEVSKLLSQFSIDEKSVRTNTVTNRDKGIGRVVKRIVVAPDFNSLSFNQALSDRLGSVGMIVAASEDPEKKTVTMHIKKDGLIIESLVFVMTKIEKEKNHQ